MYNKIETNIIYIFITTIQYFQTNYLFDFISKLIIVCFNNTLLH